MKTKEWVAVTAPNTLLIGESSMLQWSDDIIDYTMFLDYFFRPRSFDLGERSRYAEAKNIFDMIATLTQGRCRPENLYATNLTFDPLPHPPKGKRLRIPADCAAAGVEPIREILRQNPTITQVYAMGMQVNYYLQKFGFCAANDDYLKGAEPRRAGVELEYYQPVDGKVFRRICCQELAITGFEATLVPILMANEYPLRDDKIRIYGQLYDEFSTKLLK